MKQKILHSDLRSPTLETIKMVEEIISDYSGEFTRMDSEEFLKEIKKW